MSWKIKRVSKKKYNKPILIEGLPGIGNVGKIAADLLLQEMKTTLDAEFFSYSLPNSVFIQEDNLVELPKIEMKHFKHKKQDFLFLVGDYQPTEEVPSYEFSDEVINYVSKFGCKEIITLGGIGLQEVPKKPKVYCTANDKEFLKELANLGVNSNIYGKVGPIMGVSGLLLGLGKKKNIKAGALLAETLAHPMYLGLKGARELLKTLDKKYDFGISMKDLNKEIKSMEEGMQKALMNQQQMIPQDTSYIG